MKKHTQALRGISLLFILLAVGCKSNSQETTTSEAEVVNLPEKVINSNEISWRPNIIEALAEAKNRGELLFVECYSPTCPHCQAMEPYFKMSEVAEKYNKGFVNYKLNVTQAEEVKFLNDHDIWLPSFPMFLFFDGNGNLVHQSAVDPTIESINGVADAALDPDQQAGNFENRFAAGERSIDFLADYGSFTRVIKDTLAGIRVGEALFEAYPKAKIASEESWGLTKKAISDIDNGFAKYWFAHKAQAAAFEAQGGHADNADNVLGGILQNSLFGAKGKTFSMAKLQEVRVMMGQIGADRYADNTLWEFETKALIKEGKLTQALAVGKKMVAAFGNNGSAHVYITRVFNDFFPNDSYVSTAKTWLANALPGVNQDNVRAELYYELARLNKKEGKVSEAKANAATAQEFATKISSNSTKFAELIESL